VEPEPVAEAVEEELEPLAEAESESTVEIPEAEVAPHRRFHLFGREPEPVAAIEPVEELPEPLVEVDAEPTLESASEVDRPKISTRRRRWVFGGGENSPPEESERTGDGSAETASELRVAAERERQKRELEYLRDIRTRG
jgi:hypothetical protein